MSHTAKGKCERILDSEKLVELLREPIMFQCMGSEKDLEDNIIENISDLCEGLGLAPIVCIGRQEVIKTGDFFIRPDIMVRHEDGTMTVFEVKKANKKYPSTGATSQMSAVGQLLLYKSVIERKIENKVRVALIDNKIYLRTYYAFIDNKLPITLIDFQCDRVFVPCNGWCYG